MTHAARAVHAAFTASCALALLAGCGDDRRVAAPDAVAPDIAAYRYAVVAFANHAMLRDHGGADLAKRGFAVLDSDDARLADPRVAQATLWFTFTVRRVGGNEAIEMVARDRAHTVRFQVTARRADEPLSVDADVDALIPYRGDHAQPPPGTMIQL